MKGLQTLFHSPEWYPLTIDLHREVLTFIQLLPESYQEYVFLSLKSARRRGLEVHEVRLDDVLLAAANTPATQPRVHYILHTAYCCSTLLARYFELLPGCIVLKEPHLLAQIALAEGQAARWQDTFELVARLLTRTYQANEMAVIKTHVPCNTLGQKLLDQNARATITFLVPPLRAFLLAVLKSKDRRQRVRSWSRHLARVAAQPPQLAAISPDSLTEGAAAAYWWMSNRFLCEQLCSPVNSSRVLVLDAERVADFPRETIRMVTALCGLNLDDKQLEAIANHPTVHQYSKDPSRPYDADVRRQEIVELERCWGAEADAAIDWMRSHGMSSCAPVTPASGRDDHPNCCSAL
jgi:hypothetical protein